MMQMMQKQNNHIRSFPRQRESSVFSAHDWVPAFAGTSGGKCT